MSEEPTVYEYVNGLKHARSMLRLVKKGKRISPEEAEIAVAHVCRVIALIERRTLEAAFFVGPGTACSSDLIQIEVVKQ